MKLLITTVLLFGAGGGAFGLLGGRAAQATDPCPDDCKVEIERLDADTCLITCYDDAGGVVCQETVDCTEPCDPACGPVTAR